MKKYLKNLSLDDLVLAAIGGLIGSLIGVFLGTAEFYQVSLFTLVGMLVGAYVLARKRINDSDMNS